MTRSSPPLIFPSWRCQRKWLKGLSHIHFSPWFHCKTLLFPLTHYNNIHILIQLSSIQHPPTQYKHLFLLTLPFTSHLIHFPPSVYPEMNKQPQHFKEYLLLSIQPPDRRRSLILTSRLTGEKLCYKDSETENISPLLALMHSPFLFLLLSLSRSISLTLFTTEEQL